ncbi:MAG: hypothetical protein JWO20_321 [Candidatus Angelobacter sp.]|nr:hypothetical protein [Candidatus Angelobacter sp.]
MVKDNIRVRLTEPSDAFIFREHRLKPPFVTIVTSATIRHHLTVLIIVKHRHLRFASPTPKHLHFHSSHTAHRSSP